MVKRRRKQKQRSRVADELRHAIETSGRTRYNIGKEAGVDQATLHRFIVKGIAISTTTADKLCEALGLRLTKE